MPTSRTAKTALAIVFMLLFLASLGIYGWASGKAAAIVGPSHLAATADSLFVYSGNELLQLSRGGALVQRWPQAALGLQYTPIDVRVLRDGRVLLAEQNPARMRACATSNMQCEIIGKDIAGTLQDQYKVFPDAASDALLIADFKSGQLWRQSSDSKPLALTDTRTLNRINDLLLDDTGRLWVADSGHHRIVALREDTAGKWRIDRSLDAKNSITRPGNDWPMMLALPNDGNLWVVQPSGMGQSADVVVYDQEHGATARIALPDGAYPTDIVSIGDTIVVSDMENFRLYRIDTVSHAVSDFGDSDVTRLLREAEQNKYAHRTRMTQTIVAMALFGILMIGSAVWATPKGQRWTKPVIAAPLAATATATPEVKGIYWLKRNPKMDRLLTWLPVALYGMLILLVVLLLNLFGTIDTSMAENPSAEDLAKYGEFKQTMLLIMAVFTGVPILTHFGIRNMKQTLGTDGRRLYVKLMDGRDLALAPERLVYGDRQILFEDNVSRPC